MKKTQRILVFQQNRAGEPKIQGIEKYGGDRFQLIRFNIDVTLPEFIDDPNPYLPDKIDADLVLDFLKHPDLSQDLAEMCARAKVPLVASGKKHRVKGPVFTPPT